MAIIRKCDYCKKVIKGRDYMNVDAPGDYRQFELCVSCAAPIMAVLRKYKLIAGV